MERVVRLAINASVGVLVARQLGPADFGLINYAAAVFGLLAPLAGRGMQLLIVKEMSTSDWRPVLGAALARQLPTAVLLSILGSLVVLLSQQGRPGAVALAIVMFPIPIVNLEQTFRAYHEVHHRVRRVVVAGLTAATLSTILKLIALVRDAPVWVFGAFGSIEGAIVLAILIAGLPRGARLVSLLRLTDRQLGRRLVRESVPLLVASIAVLVYMRVDMLMLGLIAGDRETGLYSAASRLSEVWYLVPIAALSSVRPRLARAWVDGRRTIYQEMMQKFMTGLVMLSVPILIAVLVGADFIVTVLFGDDFADSANVLRVHILAAPFVFLGAAGSQWHVDRGYNRIIMMHSVAGAVINVVLNAVLIPFYGALGAAIATLISYAGAGMAANAALPATRPVFRAQLRAFSFRLPPKRGTG